MSGTWETSSSRFAFDGEIVEEAFEEALIQLCLGKLSQSYLPEILGFNMGYEQPPLHLFTTVDALKKWGIDPYYFQLHISIDNFSTGHAQTAVQAGNPTRGISYHLLFVFLNALPFPSFSI